MADDIGIQQEMLIEPTHKKLEIIDGHAVKDVEDYQNPELLYKSLIERVRKYHPSADVSMIEKAYHIARDAHKGQTRKSGEEYIIHPLWVGIILAQLEMDKETIVAGILHDVVEDTVMTDEEIRQEFGDEVALLVDGVTKLGQLSYSADKLEVQAENLRKMFLAMAKDIRVIIIKLADRLHNMRTLQYMRPEKQLEKANLNYQNHLLVVAQDIDETVALMCYIQLSLLGVAGYVKVGNSLTEPMTDNDDKENYWFTPMYFSNVWVLRRIFGGR